MGGQIKRSSMLLNLVFSFGDSLSLPKPIIKKKKWEVTVGRLSVLSLSLYISARHAKFLSLSLLDKSNFINNLLLLIAYIETKLFFIKIRMSERLKNYYIFLSSPHFIIYVYPRVGELLTFTVYFPPS